MKRWLRVQFFKDNMSKMSKWIQKEEIIIYHFSDYYGDVYENKRS